MRRMFLSTALVLLLVAVYGCADQSRSLLALEAQPALSTGQAGGVTTVQINERFPFARTVYNPCTEELIDFSGHLNFVWNQVWDADGNLFRSTFHANPQGLTGIGQTSGDVYRWVGSEDNTYQAFQSGAWQSMFVGQMRMISPGTGSNFHLFFQFFVKVDPDGTFNLHIFNPPSIVCR